MKFLRIFGIVMVCLSLISGRVFAQDAKATDENTGALIAGGTAAGATAVGAGVAASTASAATITSAIATVGAGSMAVGIGVVALAPIMVGTAVYFGWRWLSSDD